MVRKILSFLVILLICFSVIIVPVNAEDDNINKAKDYIIKNIENYNKEINIEKYNIKTSEMHELFQSIFWENPQLFYLEQAYEYSYRTNKVININLSYKYSKKELQDMILKFENATQNILSNIDESSSDYDKLLSIHDELINVCEYSKENGGYSAYDCLVKNKSVCQGYTLAYAHLLKKLNIESLICVSDTINHSWNIVKLDNSYFHVDVTWDDAKISIIGSNPVNILGSSLHSNFLKSDNNFKDNHIVWDVVNKKDNLCNNEKYDKFYFNNINTNIIKVNGDYFFIKKDCIYKNDINNPIKNIDTFSYNGYSYFFSKILKYNNRILYNDNDEIFLLNEKTNKNISVYKLKDLKSTDTLIGFNIKDGKLLYQVFNTLSKNSSINKVALSDVNLKTNDEEISDEEINNEEINDEEINNKDDDVLNELEKEENKNNNLNKTEKEENTEENTDKEESKEETEKHENNVKIPIEFNKIENTKSGVKLSWKKMKNIISFDIMRKDSKKYIKIATINGIKTNFIDKKAKKGKMNSYIITANYATSFVKSSAKSIIYVTQVKGLKISQSGKRNIIKWNKNNSAKGYYVYRKINKSDFKKVKTINKNNITSFAEKTKPNNIYTYKIVPFNHKYINNYSITKSVKTK